MELIRYDHDIIAWAKEQAQLVRTEQFDLLDQKHITEEIEAYRCIVIEKLLDKVIILFI